MATECNASSSAASGVRDKSALELLINKKLGGPLFDNWSDEKMDRFLAVARYQFSDGPDDFTPLVSAARELLPLAMRPSAVPYILNDGMLSPSTRFADVNRAALSFVVAYMLVVCEPAIREWEAAERVA